MHTSKKILIIAIIMFCFFSCRDEFTICELPTDVKLKTGLYEKVSGLESEAAISNLNITKIGASIPDFNTGVSKFNLDLNPSLDSAQYKIIINSGTIADTITYVYTSQKVNLSVECGEVFIHNVNKVTTTTHFIDSALISNSTINTTSGENVKIYF